MTSYLHTENFEERELGKGNIDRVVLKDMIQS
ncbi:putative peptidoglycan binding domain-containing protein [Halobacillus karajensis]